MWTFKFKKFSALKNWFVAKKNKFFSTQDLQGMLQEWPYDLSHVNVRKIKGLDGKEKIQLRLDMGILQMEINGRPDGSRPHGEESLFDYYVKTANNLKDRYSTDDLFKLNHSDCLKLQREALQYYHRFVALLYLKNYRGVLRDTDHNLRMIDFVNVYALNEQDRWAFEQFRPYLIMMQIRAKASLFMKQRNYRKAEKTVEGGLTEIERFYIENELTEQIDSSLILSFLRKWGQEIKESRPLSPVEKLQRELDKAVNQEDFERAAELRDRIQEIQKLGDELLS